MSVAPRILHFLGADRGDGDRNVLEDLASALGGDDDLVELRFGDGLRLGLDAACSVGDGSVGCGGRSGCPGRNAGHEMANRPAESSHTDLRIESLPCAPLSLA